MEGQTLIHTLCGLRPYHTILHGDDFRCTYQADAANQQVAARDLGVSHAMVVEPDRMHYTLVKVWFAVASFVVLLFVTWLPVFLYTIHKKFMQLAPPCALFREFEDVEQI